MEKYLTVEDVANALQLSKSSAYVYIHKMEHISEPLRVSEKVFEAWLAEKTVYPQEKKCWNKPVGKVPYR